MEILINNILKLKIIFSLNEMIVHNFRKKYRNLIQNLNPFKNIDI